MKRDSRKKEAFTNNFIQGFPRALKFRAAFPPTRTATVSCWTWGRGGAYWGSGCGTTETRPTTTSLTKNINTLFKEKIKLGSCKLNQGHPEVPSTAVQRSPDLGGGPGQEPGASRRHRHLRIAQDVRAGRAEVGKVRQVPGPAALPERPGAGVLWNYGGM